MGILCSWPLIIVAYFVLLLSSLLVTRLWSCGLRILMLNKLLMAYLSRTQMSNFPSHHHHNFCSGCRLGGPCTLKRASAGWAEEGLVSSLGLSCWWTRWERWTRGCTPALPRICKEPNQCPPQLKFFPKLKPRNHECNAAAGLLLSTTSRHLYKSTARLCVHEQ